MQAGSDSLHFNASSAIEPPHFHLTATTDAAPHDTAETQDMAQYTVTMYTSDLPGAGTDCTAYIGVHGERGDTGKQGLTVEAGAFARGSVVTALVEGPNVGQMLCVCVGHNDEGAAYTHSFIGLLACSLTHSLAHLLAQSLTHSLTRSPLHSLTHSLTHSPTHDMTQFASAALQDS